MLFPKIRVAEPRGREFRHWILLVFYQVNGNAWYCQGCQPSLDVAIFRPTLNPTLDISVIFLRSASCDWSIAFVAIERNAFNVVFETAEILVLPQLAYDFPVVKHSVQSYHRQCTALAVPYEAHVTARISSRVAAKVGYLSSDLCSVCIVLSRSILYVFGIAYFSPLSTVYCTFMNAMPEKLFA